MSQVVEMSGTRHIVVDDEFGAPESDVAGLLTIDQLPLPDPVLVARREIAGFLPKVGKGVKGKTAAKGPQVFTGVTDPTKPFALLSSSLVVPPLLSLPTGSTTTVHFVLDDRQIAIMKRYFPEHNLKVSHSATYHTHPVLSLMRRFTEDAAVDLLYRNIGPTASIVDVGGNPIRHMGAKRAYIWSCCPLLDSEDVVRNAKRVDAALQFCNHKVEDCRCHSRAPGGYPDAYMMIHSIYYLNPELILTLVNRSYEGMVVSVHHLFDGIRGSMYQEATWRRTGTGVEMAVVGNSSTYQHRDIDWTARGYFAVKGKAMSWSVVKTWGDVVMVLFVKSPVLAIKRSDAYRTNLPLSEALEDDKYVGSVDTRGALATVKSYHSMATDVTFGVQRILSFSGGLGITLDSKMTVIVPKGIIGIVRLKIQGMPITPATFQVGLMGCTSAFSKYKGYSPDEIADAVPVVVALAMEANIRNMTPILGGLTDPGVSGLKSRSFEVYNNLLTFVRPTGLVSLRNLVINSLLLLWMCVCCYFSPAFLRQVGKYVLNASSGSVLGWSWANFCSSFENTIVYRVLSWLLNIDYGVIVRRTRWLKHGPSGVPVGACIRSTKVEAYEDYCCENRPLGKIHKSASVGIPAMGQCVAKLGNSACGPFLFGYHPVVARQCVHNELVAVNNRACKDRPVTQEPAETAFENWVRSCDWFLNTDRLNHNDWDINKLFEYTGCFAKWVVRFPAMKQVVLKKAHKEIKSVVHADRQDDLSSAFVKRENLNKCNPLGVVQFDPRLIQGRSFNYSACVGPWIWAFSKFLQSIWSFDEVRQTVYGPIILVYASGLNCVQLGRYVLKFLLDDALRLMIMVMGDDSFVIYRDVYGQVRVLCTDCSRWDATFGSEAVKFEMELYEHLRAPGNVMKHLRVQSVTRGVTRQGIRYMVDGTRKSGDPNTSCGNSYRNGTQTLYAVLTSGLLDANPCGLASYDNVLRSFGFVPESALYDDLVGADFCSSYFWPAFVNGEATIILGPKIGRTVVKMFWNINPVGDSLGWAQSIAKGLRDFAFIPILRKLIAHPLKFMYDGRPIATETVHFSQNVLEPVPTLNPQIYDVIYDLYGLSKTHVDTLEDYIESFSTPVVEWWHPYLQPLLERDCDGLMDNVELFQYGFVFGPIWLVFCWLLICCRAVWSMFYHSVKMVDYRIPAYRTISFYLHCVVAAPLYEELFKRYFMYGLHIIQIVEMAKVAHPVLIESSVSWQSRLVCAIAGCFGYYISTGLMHRLATRSPHWAIGVAMHMAWNFACFMRDLSQASVSQAVAVI